MGLFSSKQTIVARTSKAAFTSQTYCVGQIVLANSNWCVNDTATCWQTVDEVGENRDKFYLSPIVCQHVAVSFTHTNLSFANTSWPA